MENGWGYCEESALLCTRNFPVLYDRSRHPVLKFTTSKLARICVGIGTLSFASKNWALTLGPFSARDGDGFENEFRSLIVFVWLWRQQRLFVLGCRLWGMRLTVTIRFWGKRSVF